MIQAALFASVSFNITASTVAWYGAIVATVGFIASAYNILRDKARVKVSYSWDHEIIGDPRKEGIIYLQTKVVNLGRRPVKITHAGAKLHGESKTFLFSSPFHKTAVENTLTEENPMTSYLTEQKGIDQSRLWYIYAIDARGKEYRAYATIKGRLLFWTVAPRVFLRKRGFWSKK